MLMCHRAIGFSRCGGNVKSRLDKQCDLSERSSAWILGRCEWHVRFLLQGEDEILCIFVSLIVEMCSLEARFEHRHDMIYTRLDCFFGCCRRNVGDVPCAFVCFDRKKEEEMKKKRFVRNVSCILHGNESFSWAAMRRAPTDRHVD